MKTMKWQEPKLIPLSSVVHGALSCYSGTSADNYCFEGSSAGALCYSGNAPASGGP